MEEMTMKKRKSFKRRDPIAKELLTSGKFRQRIVRSKKDKLKNKKFNWRKDFDSCHKFS